TAITTGELVAQSAVPAAIHKTSLGAILLTDSDWSVTAATAASAEYHGIFVRVPIISIPAGRATAKSTQLPIRSQSDLTRWRYAGRLNRAQQPAFITRAIRLNANGVHKTGSKVTAIAKSLGTIQRQEL